MIAVVLDTNVILSSISPFSPYRIIFDKLDDFSYYLCVTTEILLEYEEKLGEIFGAKVSELAMNVFTVNPNVRHISPYFKWHLIYPDVDDNKFVDCALAANANYLVTNDKDYNILKKSAFLKLIY